MRIAYVDEQISALAGGVLLLLILSLGGSATAGSSLMDARAQVQAPPKTSAYPQVEDLPPEGMFLTMSAAWRIDAPPGPAGRWFIDRMKTVTAQCPEGR